MLDYLAPPGYIFRLSNVNGWVSTDSHGWLCVFLYLLSSLSFICIHVFVVVAVPGELLFDLICDTPGSTSSRLCCLLLLTGITLHLNRRHRHQCWTTCWIYYSNISTKAEWITSVWWTGGKLLVTDLAIHTWRAPAEFNLNQDTWSLADAPVRDLEEQKSTFYVFSRMVSHLGCKNNGFRGQVAKSSVWSFLNLTSVI